MNGFGGDKPFLPFPLIISSYSIFPIFIPESNKVAFLPLQDNSKPTLGRPLDRQQLLNAAVATSVIYADVRSDIRSCNHTAKKELKV